MSVAIVQAATVFYDTPATLDKLERLAKEAANHGAKLVLFPGAVFSIVYLAGVINHSAVSRGVHRWVPEGDELRHGGRNALVGRPRGVQEVNILPQHCSFHRLVQH